MATDPAFDAAMALPINDAESFWFAAYRAGKANVPRLLYECFFGRRIAEEDFADIVAGAWSSYEWPEKALPGRMWEYFFERANYPKPSASLTLYRGATRKRARGMAWTTDLDTARFFAERFSEVAGNSKADFFQPAYVYRVVAPPEAVLAVMDEVVSRWGVRGSEDGTTEHEIVVVPRLLPRVYRLRK